MNASEIKKTTLTAIEIYEHINDNLKHNPNTFKHFIPHYIYVSDEVKLQLINDGFKVYIGNWDNIINGALIIEW